MGNKSTRERLLEAAYRIVSEEPLSHLSIDRVAERAGLSRRTFFLHFSSKDALLADLLEYVRPAFADRYRQWSDSLPPGLSVEARMEALFRHLIAGVSDPAWKGCCFVRISAEFGELPGHPVHPVVAAAYRDLEEWFERELAESGFHDTVTIARQLVIQVSGLLVMQLVHRSASYGDAVLRLLPAVLAMGKPQGRGSGT